MKNVRLFDTHCHLDLFDSKDSLITEIELNKIYTIAVTNLPVLYEKLLTIVNSKYIRPALGFHPELLKEFKRFIPNMWKMLPKARYIGEVGLDFNVSNDSEELQLNFFEELINRSRSSSDKIFSIHSRGASKEVINILSNGLNGIAILHWYSGNIRDLEKALSIGCYFSINYAMTQSNHGIHIITSIPLNRILLETDAPFVKSPTSDYITRDLVTTIKLIAKIKQVERSELEKILWHNFLKILQL